MDNTTKLTVTAKCGCCKGTGRVIKEVSVGDVIEIVDGSSMPKGVHNQFCLWDNSNTRVIGFKLIRVLAIEGHLLGVCPADELVGGMTSDTKTGLSGIFTGIGFSRSYVGEGFWIHVDHIKQ